MNCCNVILTQFVNEEETTVPYTGTRPIVDVAYAQDSGGYILAGVFTQIEITPTDVIVNHGGASSGIVKLTQ